MVGLRKPFLTRNIDKERHLNLIFLQSLFGTFLYDLKMFENILFYFRTTSLGIIFVSPDFNRPDESATGECSLMSLALILLVHF